MAGSSFSPTGLVVPTGNTSQRPISPTAGTLRYNTETNQYEIYSGSQWINIYFGT